MHGCFRFWAVAGLTLERVVPKAALTPECLRPIGHRSDAHRHRVSLWPNCTALPPSENRCPGRAGTYPGWEIPAAPKLRPPGSRSLGPARFPRERIRVTRVQGDRVPSSAFARTGTWA